MNHSPSTCSPHPGDKSCWNCKTTQSPLWRKFTPTADTPDACTPTTPTCTTYLCNKCGLFFKRNKKQRPLELDGIGDSSPSVVSSPKKKKVAQQSTSSAPTPKRKYSSASTDNTPTIPSPVPSPKVEEKKKRKRTTTNASVTCLPTNISTITTDNKSTTISSPVPNTNQCLPQPKRRLLSPPETTQTNLESLYTTAPPTTTNYNMIGNLTTAGICSEDLDALIREPTKKSKQTVNTTYRGFGSPIIHSYSSNASYTTAPTSSTTPYNNFTPYADPASALTQIFLYFQQPQNINLVPSTHLYNTFTVGGNSFDSAVSYPHHIVDWYSNETHCSNPILDNNSTDFSFDNDQFLSEQELFGEDSNNM